MLALLAGICWTAGLKENVLFKNQHNLQKHGTLSVTITPGTCLLYMIPPPHLEIVVRPFLSVIKPLKQKVPV